MSKPSASRQSRKALLVRIAKWLIAIVVIFGLWRTVGSALAQVDAERQRIDAQVAILDAEILVADGALLQRWMQERAQLLAQRPRLAAVDWWRIAAAAAVYALSLVPAACFFHQTLVHMGQRPRPRDSIAAHLLGHAGKYVPGKAMVVVLRVAAITGPEVRASVVVVAVFVETLLMMAVGGCVAGVAVFLLDVPAWLRPLAVSLAVCASLPTLPPIFRRIVARIATSRLGSGKGMDEATITGALMLRGWGWMLLMWLGIGFSFSLILQATPGVLVANFAPSDYLLATAAIALAMVAGFLSLLPGGAGVRELVLSAMLAPQFGPAPALVAAVLARLVFLTVELLAAAILRCWRNDGRSSIRGGGSA